MRLQWEECLTNLPDWEAWVDQQTAEQALPSPARMDTHAAGTLTHGETSGTDNRALLGILVPPVSSTHPQ